MMERFPFLSRYLQYPSVWGMYLEPVGAGLAGEHPEVCGSGRCPCRVRIVLLGDNGDEIGFVGERPVVLPAVKFLWWTLEPAKTVVEQFHETVQQAIQRYGKPVRWVLRTSEKDMVGGYNATLFFPPAGQTVDECLVGLLEEQRKQGETRVEEYNARNRECAAGILAAQRGQLEGKLQS